PITLLGDARQFKAVLGVDAQGEEGVIEDDDAQGDAMETLLTLMHKHRVWSRTNKIPAIPA
ncbi:hypothetical protein, partial [Atlantibacter hermannii]